MRDNFLLAAMIFVAVPFSIALGFDSQTEVVDPRINEANVAIRNGDFEAALRLLIALAESGNTAAQFSLADAYANGKGTAQNYPEALKWYKLAGAQAVVDAQFFAGVLYATGRGAAKNEAEAARWFRLAADQGDAEAQFALGNLLTPAPFENSAARITIGPGNAPINPSEIQKNAIEAAKWYRLSADQGFAGAQFNLGLAYATGTGIPQNDREAAKYYRLAAVQGDTFAQLNLGNMFAAGRGVPKSDKKAYMWASIAGLNGYAKAEYNKNNAAADMTNAEISAAQLLAERCFNSKYTQCD